MKRRKILVRASYIEAQMDSLLLQQCWAFRESMRMASKGFDTTGIDKHSEALGDARYDLQQRYYRLADRLYGEGQ